MTEIEFEKSRKIIENYEYLWFLCNIAKKYGQNLRKFAENYDNCAIPMRMAHIADVNYICAIDTLANFNDLLNFLQNAVNVKMREMYGIFDKKQVFFDFDNWDCEQAEKIGESVKNYCIGMRHTFIYAFRKDVKNFFMTVRKSK